VSTGGSPEGPHTGSSPDVAERDRLLASAASRVVRDLRGSSVTVHLVDPAGTALVAVAVAVSPLGVGSLDSLSLDDDVYASSTAFRTGEVTRRDSIEILGRHPEIAVFAPFPFTVAAARLTGGIRRFGTLTVTWPQTYRPVTEAERTYLAASGAELSRELDRLVAAGVSMEPGRIPFVVPAEAGEDPPAPPADTPAPDTVPLVYHLHKLAAQLSSAKSTDDAAALVLNRVPATFGAEAMAIALIQAGRLRVVGATGCSRDFLRYLNGLGLSQDTPETSAIAQSRQLVLGPSAPAAGGRARQDDADQDGRTWVILPLVASGKPVGVCSIGFALTGDDRVMGQEVLTALMTLLGQTFERTQSQDAQHALAHHLQQTLLPRTLPQHAGVLATSRYVPTAGGIELGGDWYDLITLPAGGVAAVVGDVQGHNIAAAVVMGQLRSAVRAYAAEGHDPADVLSRTNTLLLDLETELFATCCCLWLDPDTGFGRLALAGHHAPLVRGPDGETVAFEPCVGLPLGVTDHPGYQAVDLAIRPGTLLALYTDGLAGPADDAVEKAFDRALAESAGELETLGDRIVTAAFAHRDHIDDAALLLVKYEGPPEQTRHYVRQLGIQRGDLQGVARARSSVRAWLDAWELASATEEAELLATEVVTNALIHGDSDVNVYVRKYPDRLRVEVRDSDPHPARPISLPRAEDRAESGRGLVIVSALASSWGNSPGGRGKTVWFELATGAGDTRD
jgi:serine phosphatase RsbU (regulator of sigma subunit)/anti-sigma regulatory factor (Ser/Thr protein kinase)